VRAKESRSYIHQCSGASGGGQMGCDALSEENSLYRIINLFLMKKKLGIIGH